MTTFSLIQTLADLRGVSGREHSAAKKVCEMLRPYAPDCICKDGEVIGHIHGQKNPDRPTLLLCAHIDQVGFFVTDLTEDGFLRIGNVGGIDRRLLLGQAVQIMGTEPMYGVISILPPHLLHGEQAVPDMEQLCVDTGYSSAEALKGKVRIGDAVYFDTCCKALEADRVTGAALDDRCGIGALILAAKMLAEEPKLPCNVTIVCSTQEERSGHRGARMAAALEQPEYAIAVDVTFAASAADNGTDCYQLGGGPAIGISSVLDAAMSQKLMDLAESANIPYQVEVMPESTGTDADILAITPNGGAKTATVSIPQRYMHTPVEVISLKDVEYTAELLSAFAKECGRA